MNIFVNSSTNVRTYYLTVAKHSFNVLDFERTSFFIRVLFHEHSQFTGQQEKGEAISLIPLYRFHPLHRHFDISRTITAESSPLHFCSSRTRAFGSCVHDISYANNLYINSGPMKDTLRPFTTVLHAILTLSWRRSLSFRNQSIDVLSKSMDCFLYDRDLRHERVK